MPMRTVGRGVTRAFAYRKRVLDRMDRHLEPPDLEDLVHVGRRPQAAPVGRWPSASSVGWPASFSAGLLQWADCPETI